MSIGRLMKAMAATLALVSFASPIAAQEKVVFGFPAPHNVQFAYLWFGNKLGFFKDEGLTLDIISVQGSAVLLPQVASGQVHMGYANPDLPVIALSKGEPLPVRFVKNWLRSQTFEFVVLENSPIRELKDLGGKKLGVVFLTAGNLPMTRSMLSSVGLTYGKDVQPLPVGVGAAAWRRLQTGEIDVLNSFVGDHGRMEMAGIAIRRLPMPDQFRRIFSNGMAVPERLIAEKPKVVEGMGRAIVKSWLACKANVEGCVRAYWEANPTSRPAPDKEAEQLKGDVRQAMFDRNQIDDFATGEPRRYGRYGDDAWRRLIKVMADEGQLQRADLDLTKLFTDRFVDAFNTFDIADVERRARAAR